MKKTALRILLTYAVVSVLASALTSCITQKTPPAFGGKDRVVNHNTGLYGK